MNFKPAASRTASSALELVQSLQKHFRDKLCSIDPDIVFNPVSWLRDEGLHGGGIRLTALECPTINRASINVSQVHYDDQPLRPLGSATALSSIIHPAHPQLPSIHLHISWTEMKTNTGYWRMMADLNPSRVNENDRIRFEKSLQECTGNLFATGKFQGDKYFYIPALKRHRGISHFYLEQFRTGDPAADFDLASTFGKTVINCYGDILADKSLQLAAPTFSELEAQLAYHTLYLFQVLTLDRGTTSGLLVHDQNDLGILGSLPARIDRKLLASWKSHLTPPLDDLLESIVDAIPPDGSVGDQQKSTLCQILRQFYKNHPQCLDLQASGLVTPPTITNHS